MIFTAIIHFQTKLVTIAIKICHHKKLHRTHTKMAHKWKDNIHKTPDKNEFRKEGETAQRQERMDHKQQTSKGRTGENSNGTQAQTHQQRTIKI